MPIPGFALSRLRDLYKLLLSSEFKANGRRVLLLSAGLRGLALLGSRSSASRLVSPLLYLALVVLAISIIDVSLLFRWVLLRCSLAVT